GPDADRDLRPWLGATRRWQGGGSPARRCRVVRPGRETLARGHAQHGDDAHRAAGGTGRQGRRLDGAGERRAIPDVSVSADRAPPGRTLTPRSPATRLARSRAAWQWRATMEEHTRWTAC